MPLDGSSCNFKIGIGSKPEKIPLLSVPAVQHISSSAFLPLCDGSCFIKLQCVCHSTLEIGGAVCSAPLFRLGNCCVVRFTQCWKSLLCKVPADRRWKSSAWEAWAILYRCYGHTKPQRLAPKSTTARLLCRISGASFPDGKCFWTRHGNIILPHLF